MISLARIIEAANAEALVSLHDAANSLFPDAHAEVIRVASGVAAYVGADMPVSYAVGLGLNGPVSADEVQRVVDFYRTRNMVPRVDISPHEDETLLKVLRERGFRLHRFVNVLARPLSPADQFAPPPEGIVVREARPDEADLWTSMTDEGFSDGSPMTEARRRLGLLFFHCPGSYPYVAEIDGEIAGSASVAVIGKYGGLMTASVRPNFRRRGVHGALIRARIKRAQMHGCTVAGIYAMPGSQSQHNAERHGFQLAYTKVTLKAD